MSRQTLTNVLPIQRVMAEATPFSWQDGFVAGQSDAEVAIAFLDGSVIRLRVVGPAVELVAGEPVAYHPVAEILSAGFQTTTARA